MKKAKQFACFMAVLVQLVSLNSCNSWKHSTTVNELHFSLEMITEIDIAYDDEAVTFFVSEDEDMVIREYMTDYQKNYCARVKQGTHNIQVREGGKPFWKNGFSRYIEVYIPSDYAENLTVATTDGDIDLSGVPLSLSELCVSSTAGTARLDSVAAANIRLTTTKGKLSLGVVEGGQIWIETSNGSVSCDRMIGQLTYTTTGGDLEIKEAIGCGDYKVNNSGKLQVAYSKVDGDLSFYNKNDDVELTVPADLDFIFNAETKNGTVIAGFLTGGMTNEQTVRETVGSDPQIVIQAESRNGDIRIIQ